MAKAPACRVFDKQAQRKTNEAWTESLSVSQLELIDLSAAPRACLIYSPRQCGSLPPLLVWSMRANGRISAKPTTRAPGGQTPRAGRRLQEMQGEIAQGLYPRGRAS